MTVKEYINRRVLFLDGGTGTLLQAAGLLPGEAPERWNLTHPEQVKAIARAYYDAGSNVVSTNTFGANLLKFPEPELREIISGAVALVREAAAESVGSQEKFVALDVGPSGRLLKPMGDLDFEDAVSLFAQTVRIGAECGVDLILIETMNDSYETKAALLAAKETCDLPVFVSNAYARDGRLLNGADPETMAALAEGMGADAIGANCSLGPEALRGVIARLLAATSLPVLLKPNAGLPSNENGATVFHVTPRDFAASLCDRIREGVRIAGGCCGTTPEHLRELTRAVGDPLLPPLETSRRCRISSYTHTVTFAQEPVLIGERINPTGKPPLKQALREGNLGFLLQEGVRQQERGVHVLDVNVGLADINEEELLPLAVTELQGVTDLPLQIDTADPVAMERALRRYNGTALINSVNGTDESMSAIFPLLKRYGGVAVALTLDEEGIPSTCDGRIRIAQRIVARAATYGIDPHQLIFDPLAMTVSADQTAATVTLETVSRLTALGYRTSLGISNVSFGLPQRDAVNAAFFTAALDRGLSAAILNPYSTEMMSAYFAHRVLRGWDDNCADYMAFAATLNRSPSGAETVSSGKTGSLQEAIRKGLKQEAAEWTTRLLATDPPLQIITEQIVPALDGVGIGFEEKTVFLPQLLMSAEAAKGAFEQIKARRSAADLPLAVRGPILFATVKGDVHDIGKNIVILLLENYGFHVIDLGKDVPAQQIAEAARKTNAPLVGLSALMTTTVPAMEETVALLRKHAPGCRIMVGGAVLTPEYAARIGADFYGKDAMAAVRYAEQILP